jgi:hypothetical protein
VLANRRLHGYSAEAQVDPSRRDASSVVVDLDFMGAPEGFALHLLGDRRVALAGESVHAGVDQEIGPHFFRGTEQLKDVTLAVADVDTPRRIAQFLRGLGHVLEPAITLLPLDRDASETDLLLERIGPLELLACPGLDGRQAQRDPLESPHQAEVHEQPTHCV